MNTFNISTHVKNEIVIAINLRHSLSKINKMQYGRGTEWLDKLQSAIFAANNQFRRSTGYSPFQLMFGISLDPFGLLKLLTCATEGSIFNNDGS